MLRYSYQNFLAFFIHVIEVISGQISNERSNFRLEVILGQLHEKYQNFILKRFARLISRFQDTEKWSMIFCSKKNYFSKITKNHKVNDF